MAFLLTGFRASESGIDCRIISIITVNAALVLVATWLAVAVSDFEGPLVAGAIASTSEPAVFSRAKVGHECREGCHGFRLFLSQVPGKPLVADVMLEGC